MDHLLTQTIFQVIESVHKRHEQDVFRCERAQRLWKPYQLSLEALDSGHDIGW